MIPPRELIQSDRTVRTSSPGVALLDDYRDFATANATVADRPRGTTHERWLESNIEYLNNLARLGLERVPINYNGTDCQVEIRMGSRTFTIKDPISLSCSAFRQKTPARKLGLATPAGYAKGTRTIAGSMVLTCGVNHPFLHMLIPESWDISDLAQRSVLPDMIPPFSMALHFDSELWSGRENDISNLVAPGDYYSGGSVMEILGIELLSDSMVVSLDDMITEVVLNFVAAGYTPLRSRQVGYSLPSLIQFSDQTMPDLYVLQDLAKEAKNQKMNPPLPGGMTEPTPMILPTTGVGDIPVEGGFGEEADDVFYFPIGEGDDGSRPYHTPQFFE